MRNPDSSRDVISRRNFLFLRDFLLDVRYACRSFRKAPGFSVAAVLVLGIGIGAVTLMFSTLHAVVLQPLPFPEPERLVWGWLSSDEYPNNSISAEDYFVYREQAGSLESLGAFLVFRPPAVITGGGEADRVVSNYVSADLFSTLGVVPQLGRTFLPDEEGPGEAGVIISHGFWQRQFGGDAAAVGLPLTVDGTPYEVAGVMPASFDFPKGVDLWFPLDRGAGYTQGWGNNNFSIIGRLRDGVTLDQAQAEVGVIAAQITAAHPAERKGWSLRLVPLHERFFGQLRQSLSIVMALIILVPLIACANVAILFLARASDRGGELAVRMAIGGSRGRIVRQLLTEGLVIALAGGLTGVVLTSFGIDALHTLAPATLPRLASIGVDGTVLVFALAVSLATVPLFAIVPAVRGTKLDLAGALKAGGRRGMSGERGVFRNGLVVVQVALSLMLMISLGLFFQSYVRMQGVEPGFEPESVLTFELQLPELRYDTNEKKVQAWAALRQRVGVLPGIASVGAIDRLPVNDGGTWNYVHAAERPPATEADRMGAERRFAAPGLFRTLGMPLIAGRPLEDADQLGAPPVVVINQTLAKDFFPSESPLGRKLVLTWDPPIHMEVVGIVGDVIEYGPEMEPPSTFYMPARQRPQSTMRFVVRTAGDPLNEVATLRATVREFDADIPLSQVATMASRLAGFFGEPRFRTVLVGLFGVAPNDAVTFGGVSLCLGAVALFACLLPARRAMKLNPSDALKAE